MTTSTQASIRSAMVSTQPVNDRWTDEMVNTLKQLWRQGKSASEIAAVLPGDVSRNAVVGKVHRLKLDKRAKSPGKPHSNKGQPKANAIVAKKVRLQSQPVFETAPLPEEDLGNDVTNLIGLMALTDETCRWPIGDPLLPGFGFCGAQTQADSPYCPFHTKRGTHKP